eukprot:CAMPEP_0194310698 /NCGR_PEP_ID=MMETSP0171-20130528/7660_1 /TAXON_ID=218684 /ORGANISM="Corethron pennatum, Strain L29A3" /LENGTH=179 /DNA_ID=CAMNT_0039064451 /DNA_START=60 /DNA_END=595 /DNA_ORIENTATION=-
MPSPADGDAVECPICLENMGTVDLAIHCCHKCDYNFCGDCLIRFIAASKPSTDAKGRRQPGSSLHCPSCRRDLRERVYEVASARKSAVVAAFGDDDSMLSASELRLKYAPVNEPDRPDSPAPPTPVAEPIDVALFGGLEVAMTAAEQLFVTSLMTSGDPAKLAQSSLILAEIAANLRTR